MGMSTSIYGYRKATDSRLRQYAEIGVACVRAGIPVPSEVTELLGNIYKGETVDSLIEDHLEVSLTDYRDIIDGVSEFSSEFACGYEVDVDLEKLPKDIVKLRFVNSW